MTGPERREQLLRVARKTFAEKGFEATSVELIADRADVSKPVVYEHFGGKEGIYAVIVDREVAELSSRLADAMHEATPRQAGELSAMAFLTYIEEHADGFRILIHDAPAGLGSGSLGSVLSEVNQRVEELLLKTFKRRGFEKKTVPMYARMLVGAVAAVGEWWLESGKPSREEVAAHIVNLMWNGLHSLEPDPELREVGAGPSLEPVAVEAS